MSLADLSGTILDKADLSDSFLWGTNFSYASLWNTKLHGAELSNANLHGADLTRADLTRADLFKADLSDTLLINVSYDADLRVHEANFDNAIIDDPLLIDHLSDVKCPHGRAKYIPEKLKNKEELKKNYCRWD